MNDIIRLKNMVFYGFHGVEAYEKEWGGRFEVDVDLVCDLKEAIETDKLTDTINYEAIYHLIYQLVTTKKYYLIEALAGQICKSVKERYPKIKQVTTRVRKPNVPIKGVLDTVEVEITR
ncbi:MAG: dihydroneopterin aldolase [Candidatus Marinimicrobia bacterium]|nr:dihydroneopterin aldolase [Candidatus Neomarinimicrobiota bacterium]MDD5583088.1 dihydroneopterin aldolase [Candidatus Neomarinimicrobiota bacterium]